MEGNFDMERKIPFSMIYQEEVQYNNWHNDIKYDDNLDMNIININGKQILLIDSNNIALGTRTITEVRREETDDDLHYSLSDIGTRTVTKFEGEASDSD